MKLTAAPGADLHVSLRALLLALLLLSLPAIVRADDPGPLVGAASDLQFALAELSTAFTAATGRRLRLTLGSSGNLTRQILQGAPYELFLSADEAYIETLHAAGRTRDAGVLYAVGRLVFMVPRNSSLEPSADLGTLAEALTDNRIQRFAIANPEHAPYGQRASEALLHYGLRDALEGRLIFGENVSQAARFATSDSAQGGIVAYSLALAPAVDRRSRWTLIPETAHRPLRQRMALMPDAGPAAEAFYAFLQSAEARTILERYGFELPATNA